MSPFFDLHVVEDLLVCWVQHGSFFPLVFRAVDSRAIYAVWEVPHCEIRMSRQVDGGSGVEGGPLVHLTYRLESSGVSSIPLTNTFVPAKLDAGIHLRWSKTNV